MLYINNKDKKLLDLINMFGCIKERQIEALVGKKYEKQISHLLSSKLINRHDDIYMTIYQDKIDYNMLKCIDLFIYFNEKIGWYSAEEYPFYIAVMLGDNVYDITTVSSGEESMIYPVINRSKAERVIMIVDDVESIKKLNIEKPVRYCTVNPVKFFRKCEDKVVEDII